MATVLRRADSRFWIACFTDRNGRQLKRSAKTSDRSQALQIAVELEQVERHAKSGELVTTQLRKVLSDVAERVNGDKLDVPPVDVYLRGWLEGVKARRTGHLGAVFKHGSIVPGPPGTKIEKAADRDHVGRRGSVSKFPAQLRRRTENGDRRRQDPQQRISPGGDLRNHSQESGASRPTPERDQFRTGHFLAGRGSEAPAGRPIRRVADTHSLRILHGGTIERLCAHEVGQRPPDGWRCGLPSAKDREEGHHADALPHH